MSVKIRLKRFGRRNHAFWRINAVDSRSARDGKVIEELGYYDPLTKDMLRRVVVNKARVEHWIKVGGQPSERVAALLRHATDATTLPPPAAKPTVVAPTWTPSAKPAAPAATTASAAPKAELAAAANVAPAAVPEEKILVDAGATTAPA